MPSTIPSRKLESELEQGSSLGLRDPQRKDATTAVHGPFTLRPIQALDRSLVGGKAYALARLCKEIDAIPSWFVISPAAFQASLSPQEASVFQSGGCSPDSLANLTPSEDVREQVSAALDEITTSDELLAVRSSAVEEDSAIASFAGQLESYLHVSRAEIWQRIADVWRSGFSERVQVYRKEKGLLGKPHPPAVLVQRMVKAEKSGIAFSSDPVSGDRTQCVVSATTGYGDRLVGGLVQGDVFRVSRLGRVETQSKVESSPTLSEEQVKQVADLARRSEAFFGCPQDLEWAFAGGRLYLLQSRPITTLDSTTAAGEVALWDNSNIIESYSGLTSPLTFSFARHVYEGVYRQFLLNLGASRNAVAESDEIFRNMLGYLRGRVYYNLLNWYRLLAMLPGTAQNRRFLDLMLGVQGSLTPELERQLGSSTTTRVSRLRSLTAFVSLGSHIVWNRLTLERRIKHFYDRIQAALSLPIEQLRTFRLDELARYYRTVEHNLLNRWDAPVLNDFYCMIAFGVSREALRRWGGGDAEALHGAFLQHREGIISTEPAKRILEMAAIAATDERLLDGLLTKDPVARAAAIRTNSKFAVKYDEYLERFGDRCLEELKLESVTIREDPTSLLQAIVYRASQPVSMKSPATNDDESPEKALRDLMARKPLRRKLAMILMGEASRRVRARENLRFERTRVFGRARQTFLEIGKRLVEGGVLSNPRDIFHLEVDEVLRAIEGTATTSDLAALVRLRIAEADRFRNSDPLPTRFETQGAVLTALNRIAATGPVETAISDETQRSGLACSPGFVRGTARVIVDPHGASIKPGEILVARYTDPGWVLLFTTAAGVIVERGSLLSHSAIVAREMGIPAVVAVPEVTDWLRDGDQIELDGARGIVRRLKHDGSA